MRIDILCKDGSPLGVTYQTIWGDQYRIGVGGAELALLTLCQLWAERGYDVRLYNNPWSYANIVDREQKFSQYGKNHFNTADKRDVLIIFRSPVDIRYANGKKIWWSCDQFTDGSSFKDFAPNMDEIILISPRHKEYFANEWGVIDTTVIDLPLRIEDYNGIVAEKEEGQCLFSSVPDRGLAILLKNWRRIKEKSPHAKLVITSDYRLWGAGEMNQSYRTMADGLPDIEFPGAVGRHRLVEIQMQSQLLAYPCNYDELFCYAVAEAQYALALPVTTREGSLETTNKSRGLIPMRVHDDGFEDAFVDAVSGYLNDQKRLWKDAKEARKKILEISHPEIVLEKWDQVFGI